MFAAVGQATQAALPAAFAELTFEHSVSSNGPTPSLVFEGKKSTILSVSKPQLRGNFVRRVELDVLARSSGGRYFTVTYVSELMSPNKLSLVEDASCVEAECRTLVHARMLTADEAKNWLFHAEAFTPERFKAIFGEVAPPQRVPA